MASEAESGSKSKLKYEAIKNSMTDLVDYIDGGDSIKLALRLFQEDLLNENTYDKLLLESKTGKDKARTIVNELHKKLKVNSDERYEKLIEVLNKEKMFAAVKLIEERYKELAREESLGRKKSLPEHNCKAKRKDSRKSIHSAHSPKAIKKHKKMREDTSEIIQEEAKKGSRKRIHSAHSSNTIKKHKMMEEDTSEIIQEEDDSSSDSQRQQIESSSLSSILDVETYYPYRRSGTEANKPLRGEKINFDSMQQESDEELEH